MTTAQIENQKEDIFEAIRSLGQDSPLLNLKDRYPGRIKSHLEFQALSLDNGKWCAVPKIHRILTHYRGEPDYYTSCLPSIYRGNPTEDDITVNILKQIDFKNICKTFPSVIASERNGLDVNYEAIAQHYGIKTEIVDITTDIAVAAFFATHKYSEITKSYDPVENGQGVIRYVCGLELTQYMQEYCGPEFQIIGVQPFFRTALQQAQGCKCKYGEDFANKSNFVIFKQNKEMSKRIGDIFNNGDDNTLFPYEIIASVAEKVSTSRIITEESIVEFSQKYNKNIETVKNMLMNIGYKISKEPIFKLSRNQRRELERQSAKNPYGSITITSRLSCISDG